MKLSLSDVKKKYSDLINKRISRKSADRWAYAIIQKNELKELDFIPPKDEKKIWEGVMYLYGIDIQESPGKYLHSLEEVEQKFNEKF